MLTLCIDIGNTLVKFGVFDGDHMQYFNSIGSGDYLLIAGIFERYNIDSVIMSSVTDIPDKLENIIKQKSKIFIILENNTQLPIENKYMTKESLGKDRLAGVVGASILYPGENLLVIDAGTAITYDIINNRSEYLGGNISPGILMRYKALHNYTGKLPLLDQIKDYVTLGNNTKDAIISGVLQGVVMEMDGTIDQFLKDFPGLRVLVTGGDSGFFTKKLKNTIFVVQNLVLIGLNRILNYNIKG